MLILRRKAGEHVVLAGVITLSILAIEGERVKIGISAPPAISIVREELLHVFKKSQDQQKPSEQRSHTQRYWNNIALRGDEKR